MGSVARYAHPPGRAGRGRDAGGVPVGLAFLFQRAAGLTALLPVLRCEGRYAGPGAGFRTDGRVACGHAGFRAAAGAGARLCICAVALFRPDGRGDAGAEECRAVGRRRARDDSPARGRRPAGPAGLEVLSVRGAGFRGEGLFLREGVPACEDDRLGRCVCLGGFHQRGRAELSSRFRDRRVHVRHDDGGAAQGGVPGRYGGCDARNAGSVG